jgi:protein-tyrosine phosphatase
VIAAYLIHQGQAARDAIARVRRLRPGSIETEEQAEAVAEFGRRKRQA